MNDPHYTAAFWDERYAASTRMWSGEPNVALVEEASGLPPGTALDAGCGEGADAHWLAEQGWLVTAVDISTEALRRAAAHAPAELTERLTWRQADLLTWTPPTDHDSSGYDLVIATFLHFPRPLRRRVFAALAANVSPGGNLIIIGHHPDDMNTSMPRRPEPGLYYTPEDLVSDLPADTWTLHAHHTRPRESSDPAGLPVTLNDTVLRAQRHS